MNNQPGGIPHIDPEQQKEFNRSARRGELIGWLVGKKEAELIRQDSTKEDHKE